MKKIFTTLMAFAAMMSYAAEPAGDVRFYDVASFSQTEYDGDIYAGEYLLIKKVIFGADSKVYFESMSSGFTGEYAVGTLQGDRIVMQFPQTYLDFDGEDFMTGETVHYKYDLRVYNATEMTEDGVKYYEISESSDQTIEFSYDAETGAIRQIGDKAVGICEVTADGNVYYGMCDLDYDMTPNDRIIVVSEPEGLEYKDALMKYVDAYSLDPLTRFVKIAKTDDALYMRGINQFLPDAVLKFNKNDEGYFLPSHEFLGVSRDENIYTLAINISDDYEDIDNLEGMQFTYDEESGTLKYVSPNNALLLNRDLDYVAYLDGFIAPEYTVVNVPASAVPTAATNLYLYEDGWEVGDGNMFNFTVIPQSTEGEYLPESRLFYEIYEDGVPMEFDVQDHPQMEENMQVIPLMYTDHWDITYDGYVHYVTFYTTGMSTLGVKVYYQNEDGTMTPSDMAILDLNGNFVDTVTASEAPVYYDIAGRKHFRPVSGLNVVRTATSTRKFLKP